jgi:hypothetical protein
MVVHEVNCRVVAGRQTDRGFLARARELNFLANIIAAIWALVSAMGALALRAYQSFGIGNAALLAVGIALFGILAIPRVFQWKHPRWPTLRETVISIGAGLLVLFVWTANKLPLLFSQTEQATTSKSSEPSNNNPIYLKNIVWDAGTSGQLLTMLADPVQTYDRLRVFVDFYAYVGSPVWWHGKRVHIKDVRDLVADTQVRIPVLFENQQQGNDLSFGNDDSSSSYLPFGQAPGRTIIPIRFRVVILGDDGEQYIYQTMIVSTRGTALTTAPLTSPRRILLLGDNFTFKWPESNTVN